MAVSELSKRVPVVSPYEIEVGEVRREGVVTPLFIPVACIADKHGGEIWYGQATLASVLLKCWRNCGRNGLFDKCPEVNGCSFRQYQGLDSLETTPKSAKEEVKTILEDFQTCRAVKKDKPFLGLGAWIRNINICRGNSRRVEIFDESVDLGVWIRLNSGEHRLFVRRNNGAPYGYTTRLVQAV